jgi:hypothetical protein
MWMMCLLHHQLQQVLDVTYLQLTTVVLSGLQVRMITPGTSEQKVPGSLVPGVPGGTPGHTPESAS